MHNENQNVKKMKEYEVIVNPESFVYVIKAENRDKAREKAIDQFNNSGDSTNIEIGYCYVEELK